MTGEQWKPHIHALRCPTCEAQLDARTGVHKVIGRAEPILIQDDSARCPNGHALPDLDLYAWRDAHRL